MPRAVKAKGGGGAGGSAPKRPAVAAGGGKGKKSKLYAMPEKIVEGTLLTDMSKTQWRIGPSIGIGGFGEIYSACRASGREYDYVVKCEPHSNGPLFVEMHFYIRNAQQEDIQRFQRQRGLRALGMPHLIGSGSAEINGQKHRFIVMPRYGRDIQHHFLANGRRLPEGTVYRLALQMLDVFEFVHQCGYVHADLKAANILLGSGKSGGAQAYLVDFGLASKFTSKDFKPDPKKMHNGTIEYTSRDAHQGVATMRADLEILGYNMIEWLGVQLPWVRDNLLASPVKVQKAKEEFMADVNANLKKLFANGLPAAISDYMKYVSQLKYNQQPDYEKCRKMFDTALKSLKIPNSGDLDFKIKAVASKQTASKSGTSKVAKTSRPKLNVSVEVFSSEEEDEEKEVEVIATKARAKTAKPAAAAGRTARSPREAVKAHIKLPTPQRRATPHESPRKRVSLGDSSSTSVSPVARKRLSPTQKRHGKATEASSPSSDRKKYKAATTTTSKHPVSARANINFNPAISVSTSSGSALSRPGSTVINDNLTPNPRAGKTYEFNFELDVSMDANVVVNVKRKKKAAENNAKAAASPLVNGQPPDSNTPAKRVHVRKIGSDESSSPRTPAVTVKKSRR